MAVADLNDGPPAEHRLALEALEEIAENLDALGLDGQEIRETELVGEHVTLLQIVVDHLTVDNF